MHPKLKYYVNKYILIILMFIVIYNFIMVTLIKNCLSIKNTKIHLRIN
jgi:hypothetical protein